MSYSGYYQLNSNGTDLSGNSRHLTTAGTVVWTTAVFNYGMSVASGNNGLTVASNMGIVGGAATISMWYKPSSAPSFNYYGYMVSCTNTESDTGYDINYINVSGQLRLMYRRYVQGGSPGTENWIYYTYTLSTSSWYHFGLTYDGSSIVRAFLNGARVASSASNAGNGSGETSGFGLGLHRSGVQNSAGIYDECIVDGTCWTESYMKNYYNQAVGRYAPKARF